MKKIAFLLSLAFAFPASATVLIQQDFESLNSGTILRTVPGWFGTTNSFQVGNQAGLAANGTHYLAAPSLTGAGDNQRWVWFDGSSGFNARTAGQNTIVGVVQMFVPNVTESTYGGMMMFDQLGDVIGVIGVEMLGRQTLTSATSNVNNIPVNVGQYNNIELLANFDSGRVEYLFNGTDIGFSQMTASNMAAGFGDFDFYNNGSNAISSVAFRYDNYAVEIKAIPEPGTYGIFLAGLGLVGLFARRKKENAT